MWCFFLTVIVFESLSGTLCGDERQLSSLSRAFLSLGADLQKLFAVISILQPRRVYTGAPIANSVDLNPLKLEIVT